MHELSIALGIVNIAQEELKSRAGQRVNAVHLRIGALAGVVPEALRFSYQIACQGTPLEDSQLVIEELPVIIYCGQCCRRRSVKSLQCFSCETCGTPARGIVQGRELEFAAMEMAG